MLILIKNRYVVDQHILSFRDVTLHHFQIIIVCFEFIMSNNVIAIAASYYIYTNTFLKENSAGYFQQK